MLDEIWLALLLLVTISGMGMSSTLSTVHKEASFVGGVYSRSLALADALESSYTVEILNWQRCAGRPSKGCPDPQLYNLTLLEIIALAREMVANALVASLKAHRRRSDGSWSWGGGAPCRFRTRSTGCIYPRAPGS